MICGKFWAVAVFLLVIHVLMHGSCADKARYDNYRLYQIHFETAEHETIFKEIKKRSDSYIFFGIIKVGQKFNVLVSAHKLAECADILKRYNVEHEILVSMRVSDWKVKALKTIPIAL